MLVRRVSLTDFAMSSGLADAFGRRNRISHQRASLARLFNLFSRVCCFLAGRKDSLKKRTCGFLFGIFVYLSSKGMFECIRNELLYVCAVQRSSNNVHPSR